MLAAILTGWLLSPAASCQDLSESIPASVRPPAGVAERCAFAERALDPSSPEALQEAAIRFLASAVPESLGVLERIVKSPHWRMRAAALDAGVRGSGFVRDARDRTRLRELALSTRRDPNRVVRRQAARLLAETGDAGDPVLPELCQDPFFDVRAEAMRAVARGGSTYAVPWIAALVRDPDPQVAASTIDTLSRLGAPGIAALGTFLRDPSIPGEQRDRALFALRDAGSIEGAEEPILAVARSAAAANAARALAHSLLLVHGASPDPDSAIPILTDEILSSSDSAFRDAAIEGLLALGPRAADETRAALLDSRISSRSFDRLLAAFPRIVRQEAPKALMDLFDRLDKERDAERAEVVQALARAAPPGAAVHPPFVEFAISRWGESGGRSRQEFVRAFRTRTDATPEICAKALAEEGADMRRLGFTLALRTREVTTDFCLAAIDKEPDESLRGEFLEILPRHRRDAETRAYLLNEIGRGEGENVESAVAGLDAFAGDDELIVHLAGLYEEAYGRQLESGASPAGSQARRARKLAVRAIGRIGGPRAAAFLEGIARSTRALDEEIATEAIRALAALEPGAASLRALLTPPSLPPVKIEAAIALLRRGDSQGLYTLATQIRALDGDTRRRALDAMAEGRPAQRRDFLLELGVDPKGVFRDENRGDAIRELAFLPGDEGLDALRRIAAEDRSVDARIEAIHALGRLGGDEAARALLAIAEKLREKPGRQDLDELVLRAVVVALGRARSPLAAEFLVARLFEPSLANAPARLLDPDARRSPLERRRRYDREREAMEALTRLGAAAASTLEARLSRMAARGELQLVDPTFLLELAQAWLDTFPGACERLAEAAPALGPDADLRFRSLLLRAQATRDRRAAAYLFEAANALSASGAADAGVLILLGATDPSVARRPRLWLSAAPLLARAEAAYAEQNPEEATRFLDAAARRGAMDTRCLSEVAAAFATHGNVPRARDLAARAHELAPNDRGLCEAYAWLCLSAGEAALANELFQFAQGLDDEEATGSRSARLGAACALAQLQRPEESADILRALLREDPELGEEIRWNPYLAPVLPRLQIESAASAPSSK